MIHDTAHVLVYALAAMASPLVLTATLIVLRSERPRTNGIAFLIGFLIGTGLACGLGLIVGQAAVERLNSHDRLEAALTLGLGIALVVVGARARRLPPRPPEAASSRTSAILAGLARVRPAAACSMAALLGFGGPKRLVLTFLAMATVSEGSVGDVGQITLVALYVAIATALVSVPVVMVLVAGARAAALLARGQSWLTAHSALLRVWLALGVGVALIADAVLRLVL